MRLKAKQILDMDMYSIRREAESGSAKQIFRALKNSLDTRLRTFAKHGALSDVPKRILNVGGVRGKSDREIMQGIRDMADFMKNEEIGTYAKYKETVQERMEHMEDVIGDDFQFESEEEYDSMRRFMGEMQERFASGEMWKKWSGDSASLYGELKDNGIDAHEGVPLFSEARRLGLDPRQFLRNYEYWMNNVDALRSAKPIRSKEGRKLYPSDYARKLGLDKVTGGRRSSSGRNRRSKKR